MFLFIFKEVTFQRYIIPEINESREMGTLRYWWQLSPNRSTGLCSMAESIKDQINVHALL